MSIIFSLFPPPPPPTLSFSVIFYRAGALSRRGGTGGLFPQSPTIRPANTINCKKLIEQMKGLVTLQTIPNYFYVQLKKGLKSTFLLRLYLLFSRFRQKSWQSKYTGSVALKDGGEEKYMEIRLFWQEMY